MMPFKIVKLKGMDQGLGWSNGLEILHIGGSHQELSIPFFPMMLVALCGPTWGLSRSLVDKGAQERSPHIYVHQWQIQAAHSLYSSACIGTHQISPQLEYYLPLDWSHIEHMTPIMQFTSIDQIVGPILMCYVLHERLGFIHWAYCKGSLLNF